MAISKNIVDMMGGTIKVQTAPGKGSEFIVRVPLRIQAEHRKAEKIPALEGLKALVVDDDFNTCDSVWTKMLVTVGMRADWTLSGREACCVHGSPSRWAIPTRLISSTGACRI